MSHTKALLLGLFLLFLGLVLCSAGCSSLQHGLYDQTATSYVSTNGATMTYTTSTPKPAVVDAVTAVGQVTGPYGVAGASFLTSALALVGMLLTKRSLAKAQSSQPPKSP